jgi:hypothetical protein
VLYSLFIKIFFKTIRNKSLSGLSFVRKISFEQNNLAEQFLPLFNVKIKIIDTKIPLLFNFSVAKLKKMFNIVNFSLRSRIYSFRNKLRPSSTFKVDVYPERFSSQAKHCPCLAI